MIFIPFEKLGEFNFSDSYEEVKNKIVLKNYQNVDYGFKNEVDKDFPSIYIEEIDFFLVFQMDETSIRYMEVEGKVSFEKVDLSSTNLVTLKDILLEYDENIKIEDGDLESEKLGLRISEDSDKDFNSIFVHYKEYLDEESMSAEDILKFYLGDSIT